MAAGKGAAMKTKTTPRKLLSKRTFLRKIEAFRQKHAWLLKDNPLDIRPGWIDLLDATLTKMRRVLTEDDIAFSRLEFLYCAVESRMQVFVDATNLSDRRFRVIDHLIDQASRDSELMCPKCGCVIERQTLMRTNIGCINHREFDGDFAEDYRRHLKLKKREEEAAAQSLQTLGTMEQAVTLDSEPAAEAVVSDNGEARPHLRLYDIADVHKLKQSIRSRSADADSRNRLKSICDDLIERGEYRPYCRLPKMEALDDLSKRFPNFPEPIETFRNAIALATLGDDILEIPPLLMVGPPGIGKTLLAFELAKLFDTGFLEIRMETEQNGATVAGSSEFWGNTQAGQLFNLLTTGETANPVVLLDELDKVNGDDRYSPIGGLYGLLEMETAKRFEDQSIRGLKIDASAVIWLLTANDISLIPAPILSRVEVQHIQPPTKEESILIAHSIYASIRKSRPWGECFSPELGTDVAEKLAVMEPRKMKACLIRAFGRAAATSREIIMADDIPTVRKSFQIGFLPGKN